MTQRFVVRQGSDGYSVIDMWTGTPAVIAMARQSGLSEIDARHTADLLNGRAADTDQPQHA